MLEDIPYSVLKEDKQGYEILTLRDQSSNTFASLAKECEISYTRAIQIYSRMKAKQIRLYIRHISIALGYESTAEIGKVFDAAYEWYRDLSYACAYLEKRYKGILEEYRAGEPGMPQQFMKNLPPFKKSLSPQTVSRVIKMREIEKATFAGIAEEMRITPQKARHIYDSFYHCQVLEHVKALQKEAKSFGEKWTIWRRYFGNGRSAKKSYEMMMDEKRDR